MNTASLARHYHALTPWERVPLMIAALARGDEVEERRLSDSAPIRHYRSADYSALQMALYMLADHYVMRQLALIARYWLGRRVVDRADCLLEDDPQAQEMIQRLELLIYEFQIVARAWQELCAELGIAPEALLRDIPGYDLVCQLGKLAQLSNWTAEEAASCARERGEADRGNSSEAWSAPHPYRHDSVAEEVRVMRELLDAHVAASR